MFKTIMLLLCSIFMFSCNENSGEVSADANKVSNIEKVESIIPKNNGNNKNVREISDQLIVDVIEEVEVVNQVPEQEEPVFVPVPEPPVVVEEPPVVVEEPPVVVEEPPVVVEEPPVVVEEPPVVVEEPPITEEEQEEEIAEVEEEEDPDRDPASEEVCVEKRELGIALDFNGNGMMDKEDKFLSYIKPFTGEQSAVENYQYNSYSAHPINGPTPKPYASQFYLYQQNNGDLSLQLFSNLDAGGSKGWVKVNHNIQVYNNNMKDVVLLSDDPRKGNGELKMSASDSGSQINSYEARFRYIKNTDGGVIGPLVGDDFKIAVQQIYNEDIKNSFFVSGQGKHIPVHKMKNKKNESMHFIIKYFTKKSCEMTQGEPEGPKVCKKRDNLIRNGSFEFTSPLKGKQNGCAMDMIGMKVKDPNAKDKRVCKWDVFDSLPGLSSSRRSWITEKGPGIEVQHTGTVVKAAHGIKYLELDSHGPNRDGNSMMSQNFMACEKGTYKLTFKYQPRTAVKHDNDIGVYINDKKVYLASDYRHKGCAQGWQNRSVFLELDSGVNKISFAAEGKSNTLGGLLDDVKLIKIDRKKCGNHKIHKGFPNVLKKLLKHNVEKNSKDKSKK